MRLPGWHSAPPHLSHKTPGKLVLEPARVDFAIGATSARFLAVGDAPGAVDKSYQQGNYGVIGGDSSTISIQAVLGGTEKVERPYWQDPWINALVSRRADLAATARLKLYRDRSPEAAPVDDDDALYAFFKRPHPELSYSRWIRLITTWDVLWGDLPLAFRIGDFDDWIEGEAVNFETAARATDRASRAQLWPIKPTEVELEFTEGMRRKRWLFRDRFLGDVPIPLDAVVHIYRPDPYDPLFARGVGPVAAALRTINLDWQADRFTEADMRTGGAPNTVILSKTKLTPEQKRELAQQYEEKHARPESQGRPLVVDKETTVEFPGHSAKEMAWADVRQWNRDTKIAVLGLNKAMLGMTDDNTRANAQEGRRNAYQDTVLPDLERLASELENEFLPKLPAPWSEYGIRFDTSHISALKEDESAKWTNAKTIFDTFPGLTLGNVATILDLELPDDVPSDETKPEPAPAPAVPGAPPGAKKALVDVMEFPQVRRIASRAFVDSLEKFQRSAKKRAESVFRGYIKKARRVAKDYAEQAGGPVVERDFSPEQLDALLPDTQPWADLLAKEIVPLEHRLWLLQGRLIADSAGAEALSLPAADPFAMEILAGKEVQLKENVERLRRSVKDALQKSLLEEGDVGTLSDQVRNALEKYESELEIMQDSVGSRAESIARTESTSIANSARLREAHMQGIKEGRWITGSNPRQSHADLDGQVAPVGELFVGKSGSTYGLRHPGDPQADVSELANCNCTWTPTARGVSVERAAHMTRFYRAMYGAENE